MKYFLIINLESFQLNFCQFMYLDNNLANITFDSTFLAFKFTRILANQCNQSTKRKCFSIVLILSVILFKCKLLIQVFRIETKTLKIYFKRLSFVSKDFCSKFLQEIYSSSNFVMSMVTSSHQEHEKCPNNQVFILLQHLINFREKISFQIHFVLQTFHFFIYLNSEL